MQLCYAHRLLPTQCEARVLHFLEEQNKPFNSQGVVDHLACEGFKKAQVCKALDSLAEAKKIKYKVADSPTTLSLSSSYGTPVLIPSAIGAANCSHAVAGVWQDGKGIRGNTDQQSRAQLRGVRCELLCSNCITSSSAYSSGRLHQHSVASDRR